jgi:hypothetical protein
VAEGASLRPLDLLRAIRDSALPQREKHLLHALVLRADDRGETFVGQGTLAQDLSIDRRSVMRLMSALLARDDLPILLRRERRQMGGGWASCTYMVGPRGGDRLSSPAPALGGDTASSPKSDPSGGRQSLGGDSVSPGVMAGCHPSDGRVSHYLPINCPPDLPTICQGTKRPPNQPKKRSPAKGPALTERPPDWAPTRAHRDYADRHGLDVDLCVDAFRGHHQAKGSRFASWDGAFTTWLANEAKWKRERRQPRPGQMVQRGSLPLRETRPAWLDAPEGDS